MSASGEGFIHDLVDRFPDLQPVLAEHVEDNFGEVLPHVFLAEVMRCVVELDQPNGGSRAEPDVAGAILKHLEARFDTGDSDLDALISTGFLEVLPRPGEPGETLRGRLGPKLAAEAARVA